MNFEQTQSVVSRIQQILREYPYGEAVLLELLQNADDAGARQVHMHVDFGANHQTAGGEGSAERGNSIDASMAAVLSGPALHVWNSSVFTDRDLANIQSIGGSLHDSKQHDATKVGRFGLGFNSCYHLSDVIVFVTNDNVIVFDPARSRLPLDAAGVRPGGYRWKYVEEWTRIVAEGKHKDGPLPPKDALLVHLLSLFEAFGNPAGKVNIDTGVDVAMEFSRSKAFRGTWFLLPLRTTPSDLWRETRDSAQVCTLVKSFDTIATLGLLLTKHLQMVTASARQASGETTPLFRVSSNADDSQIRSMRRQALEWLTQYNTTMQHVTKLTEDIHSSAQNVYDAVCAELPPPTCQFVKMEVTRVAFVPSDRNEPAASTKTVVPFLVSHFFGPGEGWDSANVWKIAEQSARYRHPIAVPWAAAIIENDRAILTPRDGGSDASGDGETAPRGGGRMMCFFPIRQATGLPVHIHGYFHLSSDRQSVTDVGKNPWNAAMCREVVPFAYATAVQRASVSQPLQSALWLWPLGDIGDATAAAIARHTLDLLAMQRMFPCRGDPLPTPTVSRVTLPYSVRYESISKVYICPVDVSVSGSAAVHGVVETTSQAQLSATVELYSFLIKNLANGGDLVFVQPKEVLLLRHVAQALRKRGHSIRVATALYFRTQCCRKFLAKSGQTSAELVVPNHIAAALLPLCLSDDAVSELLKLRNDLIPLVPLRVSGTAAPLAIEAGKPLLICSGDPHRYALSQCIPSMRDRLVVDLEADPPVPLVPQRSLHECRRWMVRLAKESSILAHLTSNTFANELEMTLKAWSIEYIKEGDSSIPAASASTQPLSTEQHEKLNWILRFTKRGTKAAVPPSVTAAAAAGAGDREFVAARDALPLLLTVLPQLVAECGDVVTSLPLLPAVFPGEGDALRHGVALTDGRQYVAQPRAGDGSSVALLHDILSRCGAASIDGELFPLELLSKWVHGSKVKHGSPRAVVLLSDDSGITDFFRSLQQLLLTAPLKMKVLQDILASPIGLHAVEPSPSSDAKTAADTVYQCALQNRRQFTVADLDFVATLPMFRSIRGTLAPLRGGESNGAMETKLLPTTLDLWSVEVLRQFDEHDTSLGSNVIRRLHLLYTDRAPVARLGTAQPSGVGGDGGAVSTDTASATTATAERAFLSESLRVPELPLLVCLLLVACRIPAPTQCNSPQQKHVWASLFTELRRHHAAGAEETPLLQAALDGLRAKSILVGTAKRASSPGVASAQDSEPPLGADELVAPCDAVFCKCVDLTALLVSLRGDRQRHQLQRISSLPRPVTLEGVPDECRTAVCAVLRVPQTVDGVALVALIQLLAVRCDAISGSPRLSADGAGDPKVPSQADEHRNHAQWTTPESPTPTVLRYCYAAMRALELSKDVSESQWDVLRHVAFVPYDLPSALAPVRAVLGPPGTAQAGASQADERLSFCAPGRVCVADIFELCPRGSRNLLSSELLVCCSTATSSASATTGSVASARAVPRAPSVFPFPKIADRFGWYHQPPLKDVLSYVEWCCSDEGCTPQSAALVRYGWEKALDFIDDQIARHLSQVPGCDVVVPSRDGSGVAAQHHHFRARKGAVTFSSDELVGQSTFLATVRSHFKRFFLVEYGESVPISSLSFHELAAHCRPFAAHVPRAMSARNAHLFAVLKVPEQHSTLHILGALQRVLESATTPSAEGPTRDLPNARSRASVILNDAQRCTYHRLLQYAVAVDRAAAAEACKNGDLLLPTADGGVRPGRDVHYSVAPSQPKSQHADPHAANAAAPRRAQPQLGMESRDLLHPSISIQLAKDLGVRHVGAKFLSQMNPKYGRKGFQAKGQRQSVTNAIRRILGDYSDQQSLLMEMIQNADDASATEIKFILDHRANDAVDIPEEEFLGREMKRCQGPALCVWNNAEFMLSDIDALLEIGSGHKSKDQLSIGRFGVGFNSVYHITDCPSVVSGDYTLFLDPAAAHIDAASTDAPGLMIDHTQEPGLAQTFPAQFAPYHHFNIDFNQHYHGTHFRLPLRTKPWDKSLVQTAWTPVDVAKVFAQFEPLMPHVLLFLKFLCRVTLSEVLHNGEERILSRVEVDRADLGNLKEYRQQLFDFASVQHPLKSPSTEQHRQTLVEHCTVTVLVENARGDVSRHPWLLCTAMESMQGGPAEVQQSVDQEIRRKLIPWGSVACSLLYAQSHEMERKQGSDANSSAHARRYILRRAPHSMAHCFLPLPSQKGELPFHIHGCFALTSDRRGMWTRSLGDTDSWEVTWNKFILKQMIARAAVEAILLHAARTPRDAINSGGRTVHHPQDATALAAYYELFPVPRSSFSSEDEDLGGASTEILRCVADGFFQTCYTRTADVLQTTTGAFVDVKTACCIVDRSASSTHAGAGVAVRHPSRSAAAERKPFTLRQEIAELLFSADCLCVVPWSIFRALSTASSALSEAPPHELTPRKVADELSTRAASSTGHVAHLATVLPSLAGGGSAALRAPASFDALAEITVFLTQSLDPSLLHRVPLVLLKDGSVGIVAHQTALGGVTAAASGALSDRPLFIAPSHAAAAKRLFPTVPIVDDRYFEAVTKVHRRWTSAGSDVSDATSPSFFSPERWASLLCVENLTLQSISRLFHMHASQQTQHDIVVGSPLHLDPKWSGTPLHQWCRAFWHFARNAQSGATLLDDAFLSQCLDLREWPLIPAKRAGDHALLPMKESSLLVHGTTDAFVLQALEHLGVWALDTEFEECATIRSLCSVVEIEGSKIGDLLENAVKQKRFDRMTPAQRDGMLAWLLRCNNNQRGLFRTFLGRSGPLTASIRRLPLFERYDAHAKVWQYTNLPEPPASGSSSSTTGLAFAVPGDGVPVSVLSHNLYKKEVVELDLLRMKLPQYLETRVLPALREIHEEDAVDRMATAAPQGLTVAEEVEHLFLVSKNLDPNLKSLFERTPFVPRERSVEETRNVRRKRIETMLRAAAGAAHASTVPTCGGSGAVHDRGEKHCNSLQVFAAAWLADAQVPLFSHPILTKYPRLQSKVWTARLDQLDRSRRFMPSAVLRPMHCINALMPDVLSWLMQARTEAFSKVACPAALWEDPRSQQLLVSLGVSQQLAPTVLQEAATAFAELVRAKAVPPTFGSRAAHGPNHVTFLRQVSWSVAQCVVSLGGGDAIASVASIPFIAADPLPDFPRNCFGVDCPPGAARDEADVMLFRPSEMVSFRYRFACSMHKAVLPELLGELNKAKPPLSDVMAQLQSITSDTSMIPVSAEFVDRALYAIYQTLSTEYHQEISAKRQELASVWRFALPVAQAPTKDGLSSATTANSTSGSPPNCRFVSCVVDSGERCTCTLVPAACGSGSSSPCSVTFVSLNQVISVRYANVGLLAPHFYHLHEFERCAPLASLLHLASATQSFGPPPPTDVVAALASSTLHPTAATPARRSQLFRDELRRYIDLLKLLVFSAEHNGITFVSEGAPSAAAAAAAGKRNVFVLPSTLRIPDREGRLVTVQSDGLAVADTPALLRRIIPRSIPLAHADIPFATLQALKVPSAAQVLVESPESVVLGPQVAAHDASWWIAHALRAFFRSPLFLRCIHRLLATVNVADSDAAGGDAAHSAVKFASLQRIDVCFVHQIRMNIVHRNRPTVNVCATNETSLVSTDEHNGIIYVCAPQGSSVSVVRPHYLIAMAISRLLRRKLDRLLAPLCCVLENVCADAQGCHPKRNATQTPSGGGNGTPPRSIAHAVHTVLDAFDCCDVSVGDMGDTSSSPAASTALAAQDWSQSPHGEVTGVCYQSTDNSSGGGVIRCMPPALRRLVRPGAVVDDYVLLKYVVTPVPRDASEGDSCSVLPCSDVDDIPPSLSLVVDDVGLLRWNTQPSSLRDPGLAVSCRW